MPELHPCEGLTDADDCLQLPHSDRNAVPRVSQLLLLVGLCAVCHVQSLELLSGQGGKTRVDLGLSVADVLLEQLEGKLCSICFPSDSALVQVEDVRGDPCIVFCSIQVSDYEDAVETGKDGGLELDLLTDLLELVVPAVDRIGSG